MSRCRDCGVEKTKENTYINKSGNFYPRCIDCRNTTGKLRRRLAKVDKMSAKEYWAYIRDEVMA